MVYFIVLLCHSIEVVVVTLGDANAPDWLMALNFHVRRWLIILDTAIWNAYAYIFREVLILISAILAVSFTTYLRLTAELAVACSRLQIYCTKLHWSRTAVWSWVVCLGVLPSLVNAAFDWYFWGVISSFIVTILLSHLLLVATVLLMIEGFVTISLRWSVGRKYLWAACSVWFLCAAMRWSQVYNYNWWLKRISLSTIPVAIIAIILICAVGFVWLWRFNNRMPKGFTGV